MLAPYATEGERARARDLLVMLRARLSREATWTKGAFFRRKTEDDGGEVVAACLIGGFGQVAGFLAPHDLDENSVEPGRYVTSVLDPGGVTVPGWGIRDGIQKAYANDRAVFVALDALERSIALRAPHMFVNFPHRRGNGDLIPNWYMWSESTLVRNMLATVEGFNDSQYTSHAAVLAVIDDAIASLPAPPAPPVPDEDPERDLVPA